jgi:chromosome segregation ATPase
MTRIDDLPDEFEAFLDRARTVFGREMEKARKSLAVLNAQAATAQTTLSDLQARRNSAQKQLDSLNAYLDRASTLAGLDQEIAGERKTLDALKAEIEKASAARATAEKQRTEAEAQLSALVTEARSYRAERADAEATMGNIRALVKSFG